MTRKAYEEWFLESNNADLGFLFSPMIDAVSAVVHIHAVVLFGSRARGTASDRSDYDVCIIGDFSMPFHLRASMILMHAPNVPVDVFCYTPDEFEKMFSSYHVTAIDVVGDGIVLRGAQFMKDYAERHATFVENGMRKTNCTLVPPVFP